MGTFMVFMVLVHLWFSETLATVLRGLRGHKALKAQPSFQRGASSQFAPGGRQGALLFAQNQPGPSFHKTLPRLCRGFLGKARH